MPRRPSQLKDYVREEASEYEYDLDSVQEIEAGTEDATVIRVLLEDAEDEADQVGFEVSRPDVDQGRQMFNRQVQQGLRALRDKFHGNERGSSRDIDPDSTDDTDSTSREDERDTTSIDTQQDQSDPDYTQPTNTGSMGPVAVTLTIDEDGQQELLDEMEALVEDIEDATVTTAELDAVESRIDEIDERLADIEDTLSMIGD